MGWRSFLFFLTAVLLPSPGSAQSSMAGDWSGTVTQVGHTEPYAITLTFGPNGGQTFYPKFNCTGRLTVISVTETYVFLTETITRGGIAQGGECLDGAITLTLAGTSLAYGWTGTHQNEPYHAHGLLTRKPKP
ncbi:MAG: hypothetical protein ACKVP7_18155 [Hyphomicrobiaceae bacterium]